VSLFGGGKKTKATTTDQLAGIKVQSQGYGNVIPLIYGKTRVSPLLFYYGGFLALSVTENTKQGGKGMGGKKPKGNVTYQYYAAVMMGLASNEIYGTGKLWVDKAVYPSINNAGFSVVAGIILANHFDLFTGSATQAPWGYNATYQPAKSVNLRGFAYMAASLYSLSDTATLGNHSVEVIGAYSHAPLEGDANPSNIIHALLIESGISADKIGWAAGETTTYFNICLSNEMYFSVALAEQRQASEVISELLNLTGAELVIRSGQFNLISYADTAINSGYTLTGDDFIAEQGNAPLILTRKKAIDSFNALKIEWLNRANNYNVEIAEAKDSASIETIGLRTADTLTAHAITRASLANNLANYLLQRGLAVRNTYEFTLSLRYIRLEPMDVGLITDPCLGLYDHPVIIKKLLITADWQLKITAEDYYGHVYTPTDYAPAYTEPYLPDTTASAGNINPPVIFAAPSVLATSGHEIWCGISSSAANFGGCDVYISIDDGVSYQRLGSHTGNSRMGVLTAAFPGNTDIDDVNTLAVDLTQSTAIIDTLSQAAFDTLGGLCKVGNEFLSYRDTTLTAVSHYNITHLRRGLYNSTAGASSGDAFVRCDDALFKYAYNAIYAGRAIKLKFPSFNIYGDGLQDISAVPAYDFTVPQDAVWDGALMWDNLTTIWGN